MTTVPILFNNFSAGEVSPLLLARSDFERYKTGARSLENWMVLLQGGLRTRYGTRYVTHSKLQDTLAILRPFEAAGDEAYILELGDGYLRFHANGAPITVGGVPVELPTPYAASDLRQIRTAQINDVMILVHPSYQPRQLSRLSATEWTLKPIAFSAKPLHEQGHAPATVLTPSATTGTITLTTVGGVFLPADVDRVVQAGDARAVITAYISATEVTADVLSSFPDVSPIPAGEWRLLGSPVAELKPTKAGPLGALTVLDLRLEQPDAPDLVVNGNFASGLTSWTNLSGPVLTTGTHTGGADTNLEDSAKDFYSVGVQPNHLARNTTTSTSAVIAAIVNPTHLDLVDPGTAFATGDAYEIRGTGGVEVRAGRAYLTGGAQGIGWIEQGVSTVVGTTYRVTFDVTDAPLSAQIGGASGRSDRLAELQYPQGNDQTMVFIANTTTSYLQFRNNQPHSAGVDNVTCQISSIDGWRVGDVGKRVAVNQGMVEITFYESASRVRGHIVTELNSTDPAPPGAWQLLEEAWSGIKGHPSVVCVFEGRLYLGGTERFPQTIWGSAVNDFYNFATGPNDRDGVQFDLVDSAGNITLNRLRWLAPGENLLAGTTHAEYRMTGPGDGAFTATSLPTVRLQSTFGSAEVEPIRVGQALLFAQRQGSKIRQMAYDADVAASFLARDVTNLSGHFLRQERVLELIYIPEPLSQVWALRSDGVILPLTYDLLEDVVGWSRWITQGTVESIAVIPHQTANSYQVWMIVARTIAGTVKRFIEYVDDQSFMGGVTPVNGKIPFFQGMTLDCATIVDVATPTTVITGLERFEGHQVQVLADLAVYPPQTVSGGSLTLPVPFGNVAWVGLPYTCTGESLPIDLALRQGSIQDYEKNVLKLFARVYETIGLTVNGEMQPFRTPTMPMSEGVGPQSKKFEIVPPSTWDIDTTIIFAQTQPLPATLLSISGVLDVGGV